MPGNFPSTFHFTFFSLFLELKFHFSAHFGKIFILFFKENLKHRKKLRKRKFPEMLQLVEFFFFFPLLFEERKKIFSCNFCCCFSQFFIHLHTNYFTLSHYSISIRKSFSSFERSKTFLMSFFLLFLVFSVALKNTSIVHLFHLN